MILQRKYKPDLTWHSRGTWGFRSFAAPVADRNRSSSPSPTPPFVDRLGLKISDTLTSREAT